MNENTDNMEYTKFIFSKFNEFTSRFMWEKEIGDLFWCDWFTQSQVFSCIIIVDGKVCLAGNLCVQFRAAQWCVAETPLLVHLNALLKACIAQSLLFTSFQ